MKKKEFPLEFIAEIEQKTALLIDETKELPEHLFSQIEKIINRPPHLEQLYFMLYNYAKVNNAVWQVGEPRRGFQNYHISAKSEPRRARRNATL